MISRSSRCMVSNPITCCSVMRWASTPRGMECPQHKKTEGAFRPLERGSQYPISLDITPDIATEYCALVHRKTTGVGMTPRDRDGSFTHTHGVMHLFPTGVKKVHCGMAWFLRKPCCLLPMYQSCKRGPTAVSLNGGILLPN